MYVYIYIDISICVDVSRDCNDSPAPFSTSWLRNTREVGDAILFSEHTRGGLSSSWLRNTRQAGEVVNR